MPGFKNLLWVDCSAAALVGVAVLALSGPLSALQGLPRNVLVFTGVVNLLYATFSFSLARRRLRPMPLIRLLVMANLAWVPVCFGLGWTFLESANPLGLLHLFGEGVFVGSLAGLEWHHRHLLVEATG